MNPNKAKFYLVAKPKDGSALIAVREITETEFDVDTPCGKINCHINDISIVFDLRRISTFKTDLSGLSEIEINGIPLNKIKEIVPNDPPIKQGNLTSIGFRIPHLGEMYNSLYVALRTPSPKDSSIVVNIWYTRLPPEVKPFL